MNGAFLNCFFMCLGVGKDQGIGNGWDGTMELLSSLVTARVTGRMIW